MGAQAAQLGVQVVVAALDMLDAPDARGAVGSQSGQKVRGASANVGHGQICAVQWGRAADDAAMEEVLLAKATLQLAEALGVKAGVGAHTVELKGIAEAVVEDGLVDDGHAARLG